MKKMMATMLGLTLALGSATLFAQEAKPADTKTAEKAPKTHTKRAHKKHAAKTKAAGSETAPATDTTKK